MRVSGLIFSVSASVWTLIFGLSTAAAVDLFPGDILVLHGVNNQGELVVVDPTTSGQTLVTADNAFINATDIAIGPGGEIYVTDANNQQVYEVDPATGGLTALVASPFRATAVTVTPTGRIFVTKDALSGTIDDNIVFELDPDTGLTTDITHGGLIGAPNGIVFDGTDLLVLDQGGGDADQLVRVDIGDGGQTLIAQGDGLVESTGIALEADGNVVVTNQSTSGDGYDNALVRIDPTTGI
jgi:sugar lactone lactonase YvrE